MPKELDTTSRVIIIGNSSSILLHKYGELIDSYDVVIRLNRCVTKGFEKFIGNKIDIWATTHGSERFHKMEKFIPENYTEIKYLWKRTSKVNPKLPKDFPKVKEHIMYKAPSNYKNYFGNYLRKFEIEHEVDTGLLTILTSLKFYTDITVHGFTFYTEHKDHLVEGYYRRKELDEGGKHPEDEYWSGKSNLEFSEPQTSAFASEDNGSKKRKLLNELVTKGFPEDENKRFIRKNWDGISTEPIKILNKDELGKMNLSHPVGSVIVI
tara:strand:+ start:1037 stop:1834 length:798 start_codon:yes stop_codon:yes gene_type:complete